MGPWSTHFHGIFRLSLFLVGGTAGCVDSGGPAQSLTDPDGGPNKDADGGGKTCDVVSPTACTSPEVSFKNDVQPILNVRCTSCHNGRGEQWPLVDYSHVADWAAEVRAMVADCSMPPPDSGVDMPTRERDVVLQWVRCGMPD